MLRYLAALKPIMQRDTWTHRIDPLSVGKLYRLAHMSDSVFQGCTSRASDTLALLIPAECYHIITNSNRVHPPLIETVRKNDVRWY